jgi:hypothetical protein
MTDVSLEVLNRRTAVAAVHTAAASVGIDADRLLDSKTFYERVTSLDPDSPGFRRQVQELVAGAAPQSSPAKQAAAQQPAAQQPAAPAGPQQWTLDDVDASTPGELTAAMNAGLLRDLGYAPPRKARRR